MTLTVTELVVVHVADAINPTLTGREAVRYQSPPQPRDEALDLVRLLLGRSDPPPVGEACWACPIAGGRRTVTLETVRTGQRASVA